MLEPFFNKVTGLVVVSLRPVTLIKRFQQVLRLYKKQTPTQVFSCECYETSKNTYFEEYLRKTAFNKKDVTTY